ncbi:MAG TPA: hypothetical protein VGC09_01310 [Rhodopila sp.]
MAFSDHFVTFARGSKLADPAMMDANELPALLVPHLEYAQPVMELGVPTGPMRAPQSDALSFVFQSFVDAVSHRGGHDPVAFRLKLLGDPRVLVNSTGTTNALRDFNTGRMRDALPRVVPANFDTVQPSRINQVPPVAVQFLRTDRPPTDLGEPALPPVVPALCNAISAATGKRIRSLPIDPDTLKA